MHQLSFPFMINFGRTLPPREITSIGLPNPFMRKLSWYQTKIDFDIEIKQYTHRTHKKNGRRKQALFKSRKTIPCCYCDKSLKYSDATIEHILQLSKGGKNVKENTTVSCRLCNNARGDFSFDEWRKIVKAGFRDKRPYHFTDRFSRLIEHLKEKNRFLERKYLK